VDTFGRARLHDSGVVVGAGKGGDGLGLQPVEHALQVRVEQAVRELVVPGVARCQFPVRLHDGDKLDVLPRTGRGDEASGVIVDEADDGETNGGRFGRTERPRRKAKETD